MKIVMLSDFELRGGAAIAASRLATGLLRAGHQVTRIVKSDAGRAPAGEKRRTHQPSQKAIHKQSSASTVMPSG